MLVVVIRLELGVYVLELYGMSYNFGCHTIIISSLVAVKLRMVRHSGTVLPNLSLKLTFK